MPRLIYRGDSTQNFGKLLPAPYIENIVINNTTMDITVSLFINAPEDVDDSDEIIERVKDSVYLNFVIAANMSDDDVSNFTSGQLNLLEYIAENRFSEDSAAFYISTLYGDVPTVRAIEWEGFLDDYEDYSSIIYDEQGNRFKRITKTYSDIKISEEYEANDVEYTFYLTNYYDDGVEHTVDNLYFMVFSSIAELQTDDFNYAFSSLSDQSVNLMAKEIGDVAYEKIVEAGAIVPQAEVIWVDKKNAPYDGTPIQSLTSQYFKSENVTLEAIVDSMEDLLEVYETEANRHPKSNLASAVNNIAYVLSVYGGSTQLLPQLNLLQKMFTSKSTVKVVGKLYVSFRKRLFTFNKAVVNEDRVFKKLVINPKIIDNTDPTNIEYELNDVTDYEDNEILYPKWYGSLQALLSDSYEVGEDTASPDDYHTIINGFFFIDYQKLLETCYAAYIYDLSKLKSYFGEKILKDKLKVEKVIIYQHEDGSGFDGTTHSYISSTINDTPITTTTIVAPVTSTSLVSDFEINNTTYYSFLYLRNFKLARSGSAFNEDYGLMCMEFQMLMLEDNGSQWGAGAWELGVSCQVDDQTTDIVKYLIGSYYNASIDFSDNYLALAQDACGYNNIDGKFNQFFIDGMTTKYDGNMENAPWLLAPITYCLHRDLLFDEFDGDTDEILVAAKKISMKISPYTGILEQVEAFYEAMTALYDTFYGGYEDESITTNSGLSTIPMRLYQNDHSAYVGEEKIYEATLDGIPTLYVEEVPEEEEEEEETYAWGYVTYTAGDTTFTYTSYSTIDYDMMQYLFEFYFDTIMAAYPTHGALLSSLLLQAVFNIAYQDEGFDFGFTHPEGSDASSDNGMDVDTISMPTASALIQTVIDAFEETAHFGTVTFSDSVIATAISFVGLSWAQFSAIAEGYNLERKDTTLGTVKNLLSNLGVSTSELSGEEVAALIQMLMDES